MRCIILILVDVIKMLYLVTQEDYQDGKCNSCGQHGCSELGYHSVEYAARGSFFLMTKGK